MTVASAAKVAPKTFNQIRNFACVLAFAAGLSKGAAERLRNDAAWSEHRLAVYKKSTETPAAHAHAAPVVEKKAEEAPLIPGLPAELTNLFKAE